MFAAHFIPMQSLETLKNLDIKLSFLLNNISNLYYFDAFHF